MARDRNAPKEAGTCPEDGKVRYLDKASAKLAIRQMPGRTCRLNAYPCPVNEDYWHIGRPPKLLVEGKMARDEIGPTQPRETFDFLRRDED